MIPAAVITKLATLGLTADQVSAVAELMTEVEAATEGKAVRSLEARRAADRERQAKRRHVTSRDTSDTLPPDKESPHTPKEINPPPVRCAAPARTREDLDRIEAACRDAAGAQRDRNASPGLLDLRPILAWLDAGFSLEEDILPVIRRKAPPNLGSWSYFTKALRDALDASAKAVSAAREAARTPARTGDGRPQARDPEALGNKHTNAADRYIRNLQEHGEA